MSNKTLAFWVAMGFLLVALLIRFIHLAQGRKLEVEQLKSGVSFLHQQNDLLLAENRELRGERG